MHRNALVLVLLALLCGCGTVAVPPMDRMERSSVILSPVVTEARGAFHPPMVPALTPNMPMEGALLLVDVASEVLHAYVVRVRGQEQEYVPVFGHALRFPEAMRLPERVVVGEECASWDGDQLVTVSGVPGWERLIIRAAIQRGKKRASRGVVELLLPEAAFLVLQHRLLGLTKIRVILHDRSRYPALPTVAGVAEVS